MEHLIWLAVLVVCSIGVWWWYTHIQLPELERRWKRRTDELIAERVKLSRSVHFGQDAEQMAPFLEGFPYDPTADVIKFLGEPLDFIVFKGLRTTFTGILLVEVKTGKAVLSARERAIRTWAKHKGVGFHIYRLRR